MAESRISRQLVTPRNNIIRIGSMHPSRVDGMSEYGDLSPTATIRARPVTSRWCDNAVSDGDRAHSVRVRPALGRGSGWYVVNVHALPTTVLFGGV
jgi:hypothetical protein